MKIELSNKQYWYVATKTDIDELFPGKNRMIQAMKDLYPIIRPYIGRKSYRLWNKLLRVRIEHVFEAFLSIVEDALRTPISGFDIKYDGKYFINIYCYPDMEQDYKFYYIPFSYLPDLKKTNKKLHDMALNMFRILSHDCQIWSMEESGQEDWFVECELENISYEKDDETPEDKEIRDASAANMNHYEKYGNEYYRLIQTSAGDVDKLRRDVDKYVPDTEAEAVFIKMMTLTIELSKETNGMGYYIDTAIENWADIHELEKDTWGNWEFPDGEPVHPGMAMMIGWFTGSGFEDNMNSWLGDMAGNNGHADYCQYYACRSLKDLKEARKHYREDSGRFLETLAAIAIVAAVNHSAIYDYSKGRLTQTLFKLNETRENRLSAVKGAESLQAIT